MAIVQVDSPRDIRLQGERTVRFFFIWLYFVGAGFFAVVILTIERTVLSRLMHLGGSVLAIGTGGDPTKRIAIAGKDQIAYLGAAINGMLDAQAKATEELRASERRNEAFLDAVPDAIFRVTRDGTILDARSPRQLPLLEAANDLVGKDAEMILSLYSFLSPELYDKSIAATEAALDTGAPQMLAFHVDAESGRRWYEERFVASSEKEVIVLVREVTDLKQAEEARRKEVLLKEIHHRVKNNLQVISSLLALQAGATKDAHTRALLHESRNRVHSMALIHEKLYQSADERGVSFNAYVRDLAAHLRHSYAGNSEAVTMEIDVEEITLDMDVLVPCGLIINELLSNALKYAFPEGRRGTIRVAHAPGCRRDAPGGGQMLVLTVSDNGVGLPVDVDVSAPRSLGLRIVNTLVSQLHGTLAVGTGPGASFTVTFPAGLNGRLLLFQRKKRHVVVEHLRPAPLHDRLAAGSPTTSESGVARPGLDGLLQPPRAEAHPGGICAVHEAVGVEEQPVPAFELQLLGDDVRARKEPHGVPFDPQLLHGSVRLLQQGKGMAGPDEPQPPGGRLDRGVGHREIRVGIVAEVEARVQLLHHLRGREHAHATGPRVLFSTRMPPASGCGERNMCRTSEKREGTIPCPTTSSA